jgi:hypothetical protein
MVCVCSAMGQCPQDAQKVQTSHPPNPGAPRRAFPQARPQRVKARGVPLGYVEGLNEARTKLGRFFSVLRLVSVAEGRSRLTCGLVCTS